MTSSLGGSGSSLGHTAAWEILPWYVNGSLDGQEAEKIERHLADCPQCRQEVVYLGQLTLVLARSTGSMPPVDAPLRDALSRIDRIEEERSSSFLGRPWEAIRAKRLMTPLVALQAMVIVALVAVLWQRPILTNPEFRTLSRPAEVVPSNALVVRMVFAPTVREEDLRKLLVELEGRIIDGPSPYGVYTVEIRSLTDPNIATVSLEEVRARDEVEFLEPLSQQK